MGTRMRVTSAAVGTLLAIIGIGATPATGGVSTATADSIATAPTLSGTHATPSSVSVAWTADSTTVTGYDVLLRATVVASLGPDSRTYTATGLAPKRQYKFVVRARLATGAVESSNPVWKSTTAGSTVPRPTPAADGEVDKVLVFVEENHSLSQMRAGMPYLYNLANTYGYATNYRAIRHPSLPNYIAIASGSTHGITDDDPPSNHRLTGSTVFGQARAAGRTAKIYADGMPANCAATNGGTGYAVKHNPWAYFTSAAARASCASYDVPESRLQADISAGSLPVVGMVIPNLCNDAHDCSLATADDWFATRMERIMAGPDWRSGHLAVVVTADEDDSRGANKVLTVVAHPSLHGKVVPTPLTHYSLSAFLSQVSGSAPLANGASASSFRRAFNLKTP